MWCSTLGKPYSSELDRMPEVYEWAKKTSIDNLTKFVQKSAKTPLYVVGSGGSFSASVFASLLHQRTGTMAKALTPMEFLGQEVISRNSSVLIVTAGGNNADILSSFKMAVSLEPKNIGILCASTDNKLTRMASEENNVTAHAAKFPTGKDGFLATNTLIATMVWLARAYTKVHLLPYRVPKFTELDIQNTSTLKKFQNIDTVVLLYDYWSKTAAVDAESKLVEGGLVNIQITDYRNFAHGRHNWLDKNNKTTGLLALITPQSELLAVKTLNLISDYVPTVSFRTSFDGPIASINLLIQVMRLVKFFGTIKDIDPGRPGVADFGRKLYHMPIPKTRSNELTNFEKVILRRKFNNAEMPQARSRINAFYKFVKGMSRQKFGGIIFDYDGTLCDTKHRSTLPSRSIGKLLADLLKHEIIVGIATGRGKSVKNELRKIVPRQYWPKLLIGYYNGAEISTLDCSELPRTDLPTESRLKVLLEFIKKQSIIPQDTKITLRPSQITLEYLGINAANMVKSIESIDATKLEGVKIVESDHSIDLLSSSSSKLNLLMTMQKKAAPGYKILCIGDKGKWPGNDYEILSTEYSLSVDEVSQDLLSCWNFLTLSAAGEEGLKEYAKMFTISRGFLQMKYNYVRNCHDHEDTLQHRGTV